MKKEMSYKLDDCARLWVRSGNSEWRLATPDESDRIYLSYPEIAVQAFWVGDSRAINGVEMSLAA
jgi:hypothetical protein